MNLLSQLRKAENVKKNRINESRDDLVIQQGEN